MKKIILLFIFFSIYFFTKLSAQSKAYKSELFLCGNSKVIIINYESEKNSSEPIWQWDAHEAKDLPEKYRTSSFETIDECKPIDNGKKILITSSDGGVALIDRASKKIEFLTFVPNAHSAELLPLAHIVVASSTEKNGNKIILFDIKNPTKAIWQDSLYSAHGVIWDPERELLYALGYTELRSYEIQNWQTKSPRLLLKNHWKIPGISGHDLQAVPKKRELIFSENKNCWIFDIEKQSFREAESLAGKPSVKSISIHPRSGRLAYIKAEESWWSHHLYLLKPEQTINFPDVNLYKVRWNVVP